MGNLSLILGYEGQEIWIWMRFNTGNSSRELENYRCTPGQWIVSIGTNSGSQQCGVVNVGDLNLNKAPKRVLCCFSKCHLLQDSTFLVRSFRLYMWGSLTPTECWTLFVSFCYRTNIGSMWNVSMIMIWKNIRWDERIWNEKDMKWIWRPEWLKPQEWIISISDPKLVSCRQLGPRSLV